MLSKGLKQQIEIEISRTLDQSFQGSNIDAVAGGDINHSYLLASGNQQYFVKVNNVQYRSMFASEVASLAVIEASQTIRVPKVICYGADDLHCFLVLEYIQLSSSGSMQKLANKLAQLHGTTGHAFGFEQDNHIGTTPQINRLNSDWPKFFAENRLLQQLDYLTTKNGANTSGTLKRLGQAIESLCVCIDLFFSGYNPTIALVHGDLWQGNYSWDEAGEPVIYDPACYYADHEVDLAMLALFGHPGARFYDYYAEKFPIHPGYSLRKDLYNLYHILNHANLFGGAYLKQAEQLAQGLLAKVR